MRRYHASFSYQAGTWDKPRRVVAKIEWHPGELYPRVGFIVTNLGRPAERVVAFYNQRGTAEQWIKEGKNAIQWTRLSCRRFDHNAVRLQLHALAYNLGNFMRTLALPDAVEQWSLTSLREKLIKIGERRSCATGATSRSRWPRLSFLVTCSPTSCAVSTGSDRRQPRHERRHPVPSRRRRQDRCARIGPDRRQKCHSAPPTRPAANWSSIIRTGAKMAVIRRRIARRAVSSHTQRAGRVPYGESRLSERYRTERKCSSAMESKTKHLEMIQGVINRLSTNSFLLKGWSVVLVSALFALSAGDSNPAFIFLAYIPALVFLGARRLLPFGRKEVPKAL